MGKLNRLFVDINSTLEMLAMMKRVPGPYSRKLDNAGEEPGWGEEGEMTVLLLFSEEQSLLNILVLTIY